MRLVVDGAQSVTMYLVGHATWLLIDCLANQRSIRHMETEIYS